MTEKLTAFQVKCFSVDALGVNEATETLTNIIYQTAKTTIGFISYDPKLKPWWSPDIKNVIKKIKKLHRKLQKYHHQYYQQHVT